MFHCFHRDAQFFEIVLDKFVNYRILDPGSVINWILSSEVLEEGEEEIEGQGFGRWWVWTALQNTLGKVVLRVGQVKKKLDRAKEQQIKAKEKEKTMESEQEQQEQLQAEQISAMETDEISQLEEQYTQVIQEQKESFLLVFKRFVYVITEKIKSYEPMKGDITTTPWWRWVVGFMREIGRTVRVLLFFFFYLKKKSSIIY